MKWRVLLYYVQPINIKKIMVNLLFILILATTSIHSLKSMDILPKKNPSSEIVTTAKAKQIKHFKKTSSSPALSKAIKALPNTSQPEHALFTAVFNQNIELVKLYLSNPYWNPNIKDIDQNTPLHYSAMSKLLNNGNMGFKMVNLFLEDPRIDGSIKNSTNQTARELINGRSETDYELRRKLFARASLNIVVNNHASRINAAYISGNIDQKAIQGIVEIIIKKAKADQQNQQTDREMPDSSQYPAYATPEFVEKMLYFRLSSPNN